MNHHWLGEDPEWASYRHRERLEFTDPPVAAPPRSRHIDILRGVPAAITALAITAVIATDTAPVATPNPGGHGTTDAQTTTVAGHTITVPTPITGATHRHSAMPHHHPKEAQR